MTASDPTDHARDVLLPASDAAIDPTVEIVFEEGWVTFRSFRGTRCRLQIGDGRRSIAAVGYYIGWKGNDCGIVFTNRQNRALVKVGDALWDHKRLARVATAHGIVVHKSLTGLSGEQFNPSGLFPRRLWVSKPSFLRYWGMVWPILVPMGVVLVSEQAWRWAWVLLAPPALTAFKWIVDRWRFNRYLVKHPEYRPK